MCFSYNNDGTNKNLMSDKGLTRLVSKRNLQFIFTTDVQCKQTGIPKI